MPLPFRFMTVALASLVIGGCSHGTVSELPTAPTNVIRSLTVTPVGGAVMVIGAIVAIASSGPVPPTGAVFGAFAQYTDGSGEYVAAAWSTSDPNVLTVNGSAMTATGSGSAILTATFRGMTAQETFTVRPGVVGTWVGSYVIEQCGANGTAIYALICGVPGRQPGILQPGTVAPIGVQIAQSGTDLTAPAALGDFRGTLTGTYRGQNALTLLGELPSTTGNGATIKLVYWETTANGDVMEGLIAFELRVPGLPSFAGVSAHLANVTRR